MAAGLQYSTIVTTTSGGGGVAFVVPGATGITLKATRVTVINGGSSSAVYINFTTTSGATTSDVPVAAGTTYAIDAARGHFTGLSYASTDGVTIPLRVVAIRG
jgi:hypothetical protein